MGVAADLLAGTCSGMTASMAGQPLDTVRVRMQSRGQHYTSGWDCARKIAARDGPRGFFRGALPPLIGMGNRAPPTPLG
jgi:solute carrier family 25 carnitine/acylcarnitine transporter 20/29